MLGLARGYWRLSTEEDAFSAVSTFTNKVYGADLDSVLHSPLEVRLLVHQNSGLIRTMVGQPPIAIIKCVHVCFVPCHG